MADKGLLLSIIEFGGYPDFSPLYKRLGYDIVVESSMRKVLKRLKKETPAVVVAEFNFQSDFRDRTSSLESLMSLIERMPNTRTVIFFDPEYIHQLARLEEQYSFDCTLTFPIDEAKLEAVIASF